MKEKDQIIFSHMVFFCNAGGLKFKQFEYVCK